MNYFKLTEAQALAVINILNSQSVPFKNIELYLGIINSLKSLTKKEDFYEFSLSDSDLDILLSLIENGSILIKEIPFVVTLLNTLSTPINPNISLSEEGQVDGSL